MGPALPLGQESRHELFDLDLTDAMTPELLDAVNSRLPAGVRVLAFLDLPKGARSLGQSATEAVYTFVLPNGEERRERLRIAGEGSMTPKRFLESEYGLAPEDQHAIRVVREETVVKT
jgi:tRNA U38,U39,U40 pseudouridine synthase TruA